MNPVIVNHYLHENYVSFFNDVDEILYAAEIGSEADILLQNVFLHMI